jgi:inhibitor of KinA sporulation pathway (predicted exonuclease)
MALKERLSSEMGMDRALKYYGLELEGKHHRGSDDAWNISKILLKVLG